MKVISGIGKVKFYFKKPVLAIGIFDGVHRGHQELILRAVKRGRFLKCKAVVMTFSPHPIQVLHPERKIPFIVSLPYRLKLISTLGVDGCVVVNFTKRFSRLNPEEFVKNYLVKYIQPKEIFVGDDFRFGHDRRGSLDSFEVLGKKYGFKINAVHPVKGIAGDNKISSTTIRELIAKGQLRAVQKLLGRPVSLMGKVVHGDGRGRKLGFPTANIFHQEQALPPGGVYAVEVVIGQKKFNGMANIGFKPSFKKINNQASVEVHIFNFKKNLYGKEIVIQFIKKIRQEQVFSSEEKFITQLKKDQRKARSILAAESQ